MTTTTQRDLGSDLGDETKIVAMVNKGKEAIASSSTSSIHNNTWNDDTRI